MSQILVVTPVPAIRRLTATLLSDRESWGVVQAADLEQALTFTRLVPLDLLVVDSSGPDTDGVALIEALTAEQPLLPIIVVAGAGNDGQAREKLPSTVAEIVPRGRLAHDLVAAVHRVLTAVGGPSGRMTVQSVQTGQSTSFELENDPDCVGPIVQHVTSQCCRFGVTNAQDQIRVAVALEEALLNAIIHGNLQVGSELRERSDDAFRSLVQRRRREPQFAARRVRLNCDVDSCRARIVIRDEGPGFDVRLLPDPRDPAHLTRASGRGVLLMRTFMDEVVYNSVGNEVTLVKRRRDDQSSSASLEQSCLR